MLSTSFSWDKQAAASKEQQIFYHIFCSTCTTTILLNEWIPVDAPNSAWIFCIATLCVVCNIIINLLKIPWETMNYDLASSHCKILELLIRWQNLSHNELPNMCWFAWCALEVTSLLLNWILCRLYFIFRFRFFFVATSTLSSLIHTIFVWKKTHNIFLCVASLLSTHNNAHKKTTKKAFGNSQTVCLAFI